MRAIHLSTHSFCKDTTNILISQEKMGDNIKKGGESLFLRQPSAHWQVVELQTEPGGCYRNRTGDECLGPGFTKREELLLDEPRIEVIHKRIVYDIERKGDVAQERADAGTETVGCCSARSQPYYRRKNQNDAHCFENTIQHDAILHDAISAAHTTAANHTLYIRYVEEQEKNDGTDPERTLYLELDAMENTGQQHSYRKRAEHAQKSTPEVETIQRPAHTKHAVAANIRSREPKQKDG